MRQHAHDPDGQLQHAGRSARNRLKVDDARLCGHGRQGRDAGDRRPDDHEPVADHRRGRDECGQGGRVLAALQEPARRRDRPDQGRRHPDRSQLVGMAGHVP